MIQNFIYAVYLLLSDFLEEHLKVNKHERKRSFILQYSLTHLTNLDPRNIVKYILPSTTENLNHFTNSQLICKSIGWFMYDSIFYWKLFSNRV